jgi:hypothetical protein
MIKSEDDPAVDDIMSTAPAVRAGSPRLEFGAGSRRYRAMM